jgi:hypothetical protein
VLPSFNDDTFILNSDIFDRTVTQNAGVVTTLNLHVNNTTQIGTNTVMLPAGTGLNTFLEEIGTTGKGAFVNSGGFNNLSSGTLNNGGLMMGVGVNGRGTYTLTNDGAITVGAGTQGGSRSVIGDLGFATFIQDSGTARFNSSLTLGDEVGGVGSYLLSGSAQLNCGTNSILTVGNAGAGSMIQSGGNAEITKLHLGEQVGGRGLYVMTGGNLNIRTPPQFDSADFDIGANGAGTFNQSGGNVFYTSPRIGSAGVNIGSSAGSAGTYLLSGSAQLTTTVIDTRIGGEGNGFFIQNGASHTAETIAVGGGSGFGRYTLDGNGSINVNTALSISNGSMTQNSGTVTIGNNNALFGTITFGQFSCTGLYQLNGGTINANALELIVSFPGIGSGTGTFQQTGGLNKVNGVMIIGDINGFLPGATGTYLLSGGRLDVTPAVVTLANGGGDNSLNGLQLDTGGTIVGGATDGVFSGKMTQQGGTIAGTFRNEGQIVSKGGSVTGSLDNRNRLTMSNGTMTVGTVAISNESAALIDGAGTISGAVNNAGRIEPSGGALAISSINNATPASIKVSAGTSLRAGFIDNFNLIRLEGGNVTGTTGQINNNANSANGGGLISGGGTIEPQVNMIGGTVRADLPGVPLVLKSIGTQDPSSQFIVAPNSTLNLQPSFTNQVPVFLQGGGARLLGGTITNTSTIRGAGQISNRVLNNGTIRAEGGELILSAVNNTNAAGALLQASTGNAISFTSGLASNQGQIQLSGGELDNNDAAMTNGGSIVGRGTVRAGAISNTGNMFLSGGVSDVFAPVTNIGQVTVTGNGAATFYDTFANTAPGSFNVTLGSSAVFFGSFTGLSTITGPGTKDFESTASAGAINATGTTIVGPLGNVTANFIRDNALDLHGRLNISPSGTSASVSRLGSLLIHGDDVPTGTLNLSDNDLIVTAGDRSLVQQQIAFARHGGAWDKPGITSAAAASAPQHNTTLGVLTGAEYRAVNSATFNGFAVANSDVLVKYTWYGDTDFNGKINFDDYVRTDNGFNNHLSGWLNGDFDGNAKVNFDDYVLIDLAFNTQSGTLGRALRFLDGSDPSLNGMTDLALRTVQDHLSEFGNDYANHFLVAVPEPTSFALFGVLASSSILSRRRQRIASDDR